MRVTRTMSCGAWPPRRWRSPPSCWRRGTSTQAQTRQETLILASSIADYITNDPSRTFEFTSQIIDRAAYDTLVTVEPPDISVVKPRLATSWEISKDGKTYTFKLRPGVKFSSGNPLTAQDVRFSLRRLKHLKDQPSFFMDPVKDVEVVNDTTVRIILTDPDASFLAALSCVPCGIIDSKTVMAHGGTDAEDGKEKDKATEWLNQNSAGSGPLQAGLLREGRRGGARAERQPLGPEALLRQGDLQARGQRDDAEGDGGAGRRRHRARHRCRHGRHHQGRAEDQGGLGAVPQPDLSWP